MIYAMIASLLILPIGSAKAWGNLGHRITAEIAEELLTPTSRSQIHNLLADESLADAANYMDTHRDELHAYWPTSARWHYDNKEVCGAAPYCRDGACATHQIEIFRQQLADKNASRSQRVMALRLLIHMIGDIHQPLHMADNNDRGGNDTWVRMYAGAQRYRLHEIFDTELVRDNVHHRRDFLYAHELLSRVQPQLAVWQTGNVDSWAKESYQSGAKFVYGSLPEFTCGMQDSHTITLTPEYVSNAHELVATQLAKAGVRIAVMLNETLK